MPTRLISSRTRSTSPAASGSTGVSTSRSACAGAVETTDLAATCCAPLGVSKVAT